MRSIFCCKKKPFSQEERTVSLLIKRTAFAICLSSVARLGSAWIAVARIWFRRSAFITTAVVGDRRTVAVTAAGRIGRRRSAWITAWVTWIAARVTAVFRCILRADSVGEQSREGGADRIGLRRNFREPGGKNTQLNRYGNFLFTAYTKRDNQVAAHFAFGAYGQVSAAIIGGKAGLARYVAELRKSWKKCGIYRTWHTDFKEIGQNQRVGSRSNVYFRTYCKDAFIIASVA